MSNQRFKVQKLLFNNGHEEVFLDLLNISKENDQLLRNIRTKVRTALRKGFSLIRNSHTDSPELTYISQLHPKFWTQGSYAYKTMNTPCCTPPQQIDLDDGVYFPMVFAENNPRAASRLIFKVVDGILKELAKSEGWEFNDQKETCVRLNINEHIHLDVPIYAIPEERYAALTESMTVNDSKTFSMDSSLYLDKDQIYLAKRGMDCWVQSDPMLIHQWFVNSTRLHSERLRRVCRYIKAWRDYTWQNGGGPSSIALMAAVTETFNDNLNSTSQSFSSDCEALLAVTKALPEQFKAGIANPTEQEILLYPLGQSDNEQADILSELETLEGKIENGLCSSKSKADVIIALQESFGNRIPDKIDLIEHISAADSIRNVPVQKQPKPVTPATQRSA